MCEGQLLSKWNEYQSCLMASKSTEVDSQNAFHSSSAITASSPPWKTIHRCGRPSGLGGSGCALRLIQVLLQYHVLSCTVRGFVICPTFSFISLAVSVSFFSFAFCCKICFHVVVGKKKILFQAINVLNTNFFFLMLWMRVFNVCHFLACNKCFVFFI